MLLLLALVVCAAALLWLLGTQNHSYWRSRGVPGPPPSLFLGTQRAVLLGTESPLDYFRRLYLEYKEQPYVGMLLGRQPALLICDLDLVKQVLTKDFECFPDRGFVFTTEKSGPLSANLFVMGGVRWKALRARLSPTFTSGRMRRMFPLVLTCARELQRVLAEPASRGECVELRELACRFSTDVIGSCAFGVDCNSLSDPEAEFRVEGAKAFQVTTAAKVRMAIFSLFPQLAPVLQFFLQGRSSFEEFFLRVVKENIEYREKNNVKREDFLDLLIELKRKGRIVDDKVDLIEDPFLKVPVSTASEEMKFTDTLLASQAFVFFFAGFETSSSAISFVLLELAQHPDIQERLRDEVDAMLDKHGDFTYEGVMGMPYLDKVVSEAMRKYPAGASLFRKLLRPYRLPSGLVLEPGTKIHIPLFGIHHDPDIYPEPDRFDPERFSPEAKAARHPYAYMPFGEGPRMCIGMRFGLLETKLGVAAILARYELRPSPLTVYPVRFKKGAFITATEDGFDLIVTKRPARQATPAPSEH